MTIPKAQITTSSYTTTTVTIEEGGQTVIIADVTENMVRMNAHVYSAESLIALADWLRGWRPEQSDEGPPR